MLLLDDIHTYYGESYVLQGVSLEVPAGSVVALLGRNGTGKTTTVSSVVGFVPPRRGRVLLLGADITGLSPYQISKKGLALVPQGRRIFPSLSVRENLEMGARTRPNSGAWDLERVYSLFPILRERARYRGTLLSGGEQQMLAVGRALMTNPLIVVMDEPSEGLAPIMVRHLVGIIRQLKEAGLSILLVEQNLPMALAVADYAFVLNKGTIVHESTPQALRDADEVKRRYLGTG